MSLGSFLKDLESNKYRMASILEECSSASYKPTLSEPTDTKRDTELKILLDLFLLHRFVSQNFEAGANYYKFIQRLSDLINSKMQQNKFRFTALRKADQVRIPFVHITSIVIGGAIHHCYSESVLFENFKDCFESNKEP